MSDTQARAVRFDEYGGPEVYQVVDIPMPQPGAGEVVVAIRATGINPGEAKIRGGAMRQMTPATFPSGEGTDLAGVVTAVGEGVEGFAVGDEVLGYSWTRSAHATHANVPVTQLIPKPAGLSWEVAGGLVVIGSTAWAAVDAVAAKPGETVAVSAAAGGVGGLVVQLLAKQGVRVLAIASEANADWLRSKGAEPVTYGEGLTERLRENGPVDAFIDTYGPEYIDVAVDLGVPVARIETIASFQKAAELGLLTQGHSDASTPEVLTELADRLVAGELEIPVAATYPLDQVREAFEELEKGHTRGKIVLIP